MPFNGSNGTFTRLFNFVADAAANIKILASRMDGELNGFAAGLSNCITRDGQSPPTADLPMGARKIVNLGTPTASGDAVTKAYADGFLPLAGGNIAGVLTVGGAAVWNTSNFNPNGYAALAGAAFTGGVHAPTLFLDSGNYTGTVQISGTQLQVLNNGGGGLLFNGGVAQFNQGVLSTAPIKRDALFFMDLGSNGTLATLNFDSGDFDSFNRSSNTRVSVIGGSVITTTSQDGFLVSGKIGRGTNFFMDFVGGVPAVVFEVDGNGNPFTYIGFNPANSNWFWVTRGVVIKQLTAAGAFV